MITGKMVFEALKYELGGLTTGSGHDAIIKRVLRNSEFKIVNEEDYTSIRVDGEVDCESIAEFLNKECGAR